MRAGKGQAHSILSMAEQKLPADFTLFMNYPHGKPMATEYYILGQRDKAIPDTLLFLLAVAAEPPSPTATHAATWQFPHESTTPTC